MGPCGVLIIITPFEFFPTEKWTLYSALVIELVIVANILLLPTAFTRERIVRDLLNTIHRSDDKSLLDPVLSLTFSIYSRHLNHDCFFFINCSYDIKYWGRVASTTTNGYLTRVHILPKIRRVSCRWTCAKDFDQQ